MNDGREEGKETKLVAKQRRESIRGADPRGEIQFLKKYERCGSEKRTELQPIREHLQSQN